MRRNGSIIAYCTIIPTPTLASYMLCGAQNGLSELLLASYTLCGAQNGLSEVLQFSYTRCSVWSGLSKLLQASYTLCGSQNGLSERLQASYTLCCAHNELSELLQDSYTRLLCSKQTLRTTTSLLHALQCFHTWGDYRRKALAGSSSGTPNLLQ